MPKAFPTGLSAVFIANNGFVSDVVVCAGVATPLWAVGTGGINPALGRTNGTISTIYTLTIENPTAGAVTAWLEVAGVGDVTPEYNLNAGETAVISFVAGLNIGNQDIDCNASANLVEFQVVGIQV